MKKFFTSRGGAIVVAVLVVLLSTYFGAYRSLSIASREVADGFSDGVYYKDSSGNEFLHPSIRKQLTNRTEAGITMATVFNQKFPEVEAESAALRDAYNVMRDLLYSDAGPRALYEADRAMDKAFYALSNKVDALDLDKTDQEKVEAARLEMSEAAAAIEESGYNESVRRFDRETLSIFPANVFMAICPVTEPELFEGSGAAVDAEAEA